MWNILWNCNILVKKGGIRIMKKFKGFKKIIGRFFLFVKKYKFFFIIVIICIILVVIMNVFVFKIEGLIII